MAEFSHIPVLLEECIAGLNIKKHGIYIDCTTGGGGHSLEIAKRLDFGKGKLICFDRDIEAINHARQVLKDYSPMFINKTFSELNTTLDKQGVEKADGILMDLGVSSYQLDNKDRGFSFHENAPLDMRMGEGELSAFTVINTYSAEELVNILFRYGEEKFARGIVSGIIKAREVKAVETTAELAEIIKNNVPLKVRREKNPCRKTFQAVRIEVNNEFGELETGLSAGFDRLNSGGRLAIITFHSLEDRIVKNAFKEFIAGCDCPRDFPLCVCGKKPKGILVNKKPITAAETELTLNNRSRSAKLRIIEKL